MKSFFVKPALSLLIPTVIAEDQSESDCEILDGQPRAADDDEEAATRWIVIGYDLDLPEDEPLDNLVDEDHDEGAREDGIKNRQVIEEDCEWPSKRVRRQLEVPVRVAHLITQQECRAVLEKALTDIEKLISS